MTLRRRALAFALPLAALSLAALLVACAPRVALSYLPEGGSYTAADVGQVLDRSELARAAKVPTDEAPALRQQALASLRRHGEDAAALADTLTRDFPADAASVPLVVERATFEGKPAWVVAEVWGDAGGTLSHRRLWVFSYDDRAVIAAQSAP